MNTPVFVNLGVCADKTPAQLDVSALVGSHGCIIANSGGGKSGLIRRLLEVTHGKVQHVVLDAEDEFYTLRERYSYVIAGGTDGDTAATPENAAQLARATLEHHFSLVAQINDLGADGSREFVGRFLEALVSSPRELWRPLLVVLDEAQRFAPQDGRTAASDGVKALTAQGRKRGFTAILASQRLAKIDKDVTGDVNNWFLGRVGQSVDRKAVADTLGFSPSSAEARGLQSLPNRSFWSFGPALTRIPELFRVGDVETTPVRPGQAKVATMPAPEALGKILSALAAVTARPTAVAGSAASSSESLNNAERTELERYRTEWQKLTRELPLVLDRLHRADEARVSAVATLEVVLDPLCPLALPPEAEINGAAVSPAPEPTVAEPVPAAPNLGGVKLSKASLAILAVLAAHAPRARARTKSQVALQAGYSAQGGGFRNALGSLRSLGLIEGFDDLRITAVGVAAAGTIRPMPTGKALVEFWSGELGAAAAAVLRAMTKVSRRQWNSEEVAAATNYEAKGGGFRNALGKLRTLGLISGGNAQMVANEDLFEGGGRR